jgi:Holliday junction resolvase
VTRRAAKVDANQPAIVEALREAGYQVVDVHGVGFGFPDILAVTKSGINVLIEIKSPGGKLNQRELDFHQSFRGALGIAFSADEAISIMQWFERGYVARKDEIAF